MIYFKFTYKTMGAHTRVLVRSGTTIGSLALCGDLMFRNEEWALFKGSINDSWPDGSAAAIVEDRDEMQQYGTPGEEH